MPIALPKIPTVRKDSRTPLVSTGSLDQFPKIDLTPAIGVEFRENWQHPEQTVQLKDWLDDEQKIHDLAVLISQRGVVFFRQQHGLTAQDQKILMDKLGKVTGRPQESGLHVHPITPEASELGDEITVVTSEFNAIGLNSSRIASRIWHSDISFEPHPSDYACLRLHTLPPVGGDTLWSSSYSAYDRLSPTMQKILEGLTATHVGDGFLDVGKRDGITFREPRGSPENVGQGLSAVHPVVRTNPVTGWKGLYVNRTFTKKINELSKDESDYLLEYLFNHTAENHDLQVRFRWEQGSFAIWDNRSTQHCATLDFERHLARSGERAMSVGEAPYLDAKSTGRQEALKLARGIA